VLEGQAREEGMLTLTEDGLYKAAQGQTSIEEVVELAGEQ
jgi:type II secretory ATPase GspE/PulE/Tfp pilus assembly ATPase PilB-like protein